MNKEKISIALEPSVASGYVCGHVVQFKKPCRVREFVDDILEQHPNEWGEIRFFSQDGVSCCSYYKGELRHSSLTSEEWSQNLLRACALINYPYVGYDVYIQKPKRR